MAISNLQFTRSGSAVELTWDGILANEDSWTVRLLDPMGYGDSFTSTTTANTATVQVGSWIDREIQVHSTQDESDSINIAIPNDRPVLTAVTLTSVTREGEWNTLTVEFSADWLQSAKEEGMSYYGTVYYSVAGDDSISFSNNIEHLGGSQFRMMADVPVLPDGQEYLVTVEIEVIDPYGPSFGLSPRPEHRLSNAVQSEITSVDFRVLVGNAGAIIPRVLYVNWTVSATPLALEIETRIDGEDWQYTLGVAAVNGHFEEWLHGQNDPTGTTDATGPLDVAHGFRYSDGGRNPTNAHTIEARARIAGSNDPWVIAATTVSLALRSKYFPFIDWTINRQYAKEVSWEAPFFMGDVPDEMRREWRFSIDGGGDYLVSNADEWLAKIPRDRLNGTAQLIQFYAKLIRASDDQLISVIPTSLRLVLLPTRASLEIPDEPYQPQWVTGYGGSLSLMIPGVHHSMITSFADENGPVGFTSRNVGATAIIEDIVLPANGLTYSFTLTIHRINKASGFENTQTLFTAIKMPAPAPVSPEHLTAELLRPGAATIPDQVRLSWPAGHLVQCVAIINSRLSVLGYADSTESSAVFEGIHRKLQRGSGSNPVRFGVRGYHHSRGKGLMTISQALLIQALPVPTPTPVLDPVLDYMDLIQAITDEQTNASPLLLADVELIVQNGLSKIKEVIARGGSVNLNYFGDFTAAWKNSERQPNFSFDNAFKRGVADGVVIP